MVESMIALLYISVYRNEKASQNSIFLEVKLRISKSWNNRTFFYPTIFYLSSEIAYAIHAVGIVKENLYFSKVFFSDILAHWIQSSVTYRFFDFYFIIKKMGTIYTCEL